MKYSGHVEHITKGMKILEFQLWEPRLIFILIFKPTDNMKISDLKIILMTKKIGGVTGGPRPLL